MEPLTKAERRAIRIREQRKKTNFRLRSLKNDMTKCASCKHYFTPTEEGQVYCKKFACRYGRK